MKRVFCIIATTTILLVGCSPTTATTAATSTTKVASEETKASLTTTTTEKPQTTTATEKSKVTTGAAPTTQKEESTVKKTAPATKATTKATSSKKTTAKKQTVVQAADPNTGISWDGKSAIVYTYTDGSTGTTPQDGATYEYAPGVNRIYIAPTAVYDGKCSKCGKTEGDGQNGTCLSYWTGGDHECPNCGIVIPEKTCHTCK